MPQGLVVLRVLRHPETPAPRGILLEEPRALPRLSESVDGGRPRLPPRRLRVHIVVAVAVVVVRGDHSARDLASAAQSTGPDASRAPDPTPPKSPGDPGAPGTGTVILELTPPTPRTPASSALSATISAEMRAASSSSIAVDE